MVSFLAHPASVTSAAETVSGLLMLLEMHAHTSEFSSCSRIAAVDLVRAVAERGLQGIVLTDHHHLWPEGAVAGLRVAAGVPAHFLILAAQEVTTPPFGDILVYGATASIPAGTPVEAIARDFPQAALVWAHPYRGGRKIEPRMLRSPLLHGIEIFNSNHTVRENRQGLHDWHLYKFTAIAGTDTHAGSYAGSYPTHFCHPVKNIVELAEEIRSGRCRPFSREIVHNGANTKVTEVRIGLPPGPAEAERLIIKATETDEKWEAADRAYTIMKVFTDSGFNDDTFRIPRPLDEDIETRTVVEEFIEGMPLHKIILSEQQEEGRRCVRLAAAWLARLHSMAVRLNTPEQFLDKEKARLQRYVEYFSAAGHPDTRKAEEISGILAEEVVSVMANGGRFVQGHGDFHPKNIYIGRDSSNAPFAAAIDFDSSYTQPPSFDVGYFLAQLRSQFFDRKDILRDYPDEDFISAYAAGGGVIYPGFLREVEVFKARTNLNIASFLVWLGRGDDDAVWRLLVEADRILSVTISHS